MNEHHQPEALIPNRMALNKSRFEKIKMRIGQFIIQEDSAVYLVPTGFYIMVTAVFIAVLKNRKTELRLFAG